MPEQLSGESLDARFFEVCEGWKQYPMGERMLWRHNVPCELGRMTRWEQELPEVSTDASACEAWAMRWAREQGLYWAIEHDLKDYMTGERYDWACLWTYDGTDPVNQSDGQGTDWKEAFVRACVAAGEILKQAKGGA